MTKLKIVAVHEVAARVAGLLSTVRFHPNVNALALNVYAVFLSLISAGLGVALWKRYGKWLSLSWQVLQILRLTSTAVMLRFLVGVECTLQFRGPLINVFTDAGVSILVFHPYTRQSL